MQVAETVARLQVGIGLGERHDLAEGAGQHPLQPAARRHVALGDAADRGAQLRHLLEQRPLVGGVALHRRDEVGDEVGAALQLDVDAAPAFGRHLPGPDQAVVEDDGNDRDRGDDQKHDPCGHGVPLRPIKGMPYLFAPSAPKNTVSHFFWAA